MKTVKIKYNGKQHEFALTPLGDYQNEDYENREGHLQKIVMVHKQGCNESLWVWVNDADLATFKSSSPGDATLCVTLMNGSIFGYPWGLAVPIEYNYQTQTWDFCVALMDIEASERAEYSDSNGGEWNVYNFYANVKETLYGNGEKYYTIINKYGEHLDLDENELNVIYQRIEEINEETEEDD